MWVCTFSCVSVLNLIYYFNKHGDVRAEVIILQVTTLKSCDHSQNSQVDNMSALTQSQFKTSSHFTQFLKKIWTVLHIPSLNDILNDEQNCLACRNRCISLWTPVGIAIIMQIDYFSSPLGVNLKDVHAVNDCNVVHCKWFCTVTKKCSHLFRPLCSPSDNKIDITWTQLDPSKIVVFYIDLSPVTSVEPVNLEWVTLALVDILVNGWSACVRKWLQNWIYF